MKGRLNSIFKFGRLRAHGSRGRVQVEETSGEIHSDLEHPQEFGFESKAPAGSETYSAYRGGNQDSGAVLVIAGKAPINVGDGDVCIYNSAGTTIQVSGGSIKINGDSFGGLVTVDDLTTKLNLLVASFNLHSHVSAGLNDTIADLFIAADYENGDVTHG